MNLTSEIKFLQDQIFVILAALISKEQIAPFVKQMEKDEKLHPNVLNTLFNSGVRVIILIDSEKSEGQQLF